MSEARDTLIERRGPVVLPNKDLWHGFDPSGATEREDNIVLPVPEDDTVTDEERVSVSGPGHACPWCGEESETDAQAKEHIQAFHASSLMSSAEHERRALEAVHNRQGQVPAGPIEGE